MYSPYHDIDAFEARDVGHHQGRVPMSSDQTTGGMSPQQYTGSPHGRNRPQEFSHETLLEESSDDEWPDADPEPLPPERKRSSSPSMAFAGPNKRHRNDNSVNGLHAFHNFSDLRTFNNQKLKSDSNFPGRPRTGLEISSVDRSRRHMNRQVDEKNVDARYTSVQPVFLHDDTIARFQGERDRYARAQSQQPTLRRLPVSRATSRTRDNARIGFSHVERQEFSMNGARLDDDERQQFNIDQERSSQLRNYKRFGSMAPEILASRLQQKRSSRQLYAVQPPSLGSAIWENDTEHAGDSTPATKVNGNYMDNDGLVAHPHSDQPQASNNRRDRQQSVAPRTPAIQRREQSVDPQTPANQRVLPNPYQSSSIRRSQSRGFAPPTSVNHRERSSSRHPQTPLFENNVRGPQTPPHHYADSVSDTSPLEDYFKKAPGGSKRTVGASSFNARQSLPQHSIFTSRGAQKLQPRTPPRPARNLPPEHEIISLLSPDDDGHINLSPPLVKSIPMKERIPSAKPSLGNRPITKPNVLPQSKPKVDWKPKTETKPENKPQDEILAEIERQKRAAEVILEKEENARTAALQLEIFGEVVPEDEETRKRREEKERAENQRQREAAELEKATVLEQKRLAEVEKARQRAEAAEQARIEKEKQEAINKTRREAERKRQEAAEALERERLRQKAEEKIQADRLKKAAEDAERERERQKANAIQAEQAELARLRAKQEETRKQVASLSISKLAAHDKANADSQRDVADSDDMSIDNPLFVSDEPSKLNDDPLQNSAMPISDHKQADQPTPRKPTMPCTAAEAMAIAQTQRTIPSYRDAREARDAELAKEKRAKAREQIERRRSREVPIPAVSQPANASFPGLNPSSNPSKIVKSTPKAKSASQPTSARKKQPISKTTALFQPTLLSGNFGGLTKQLNRKFSKQKGPSSICSSVASAAPANFLSDRQHQKMLEEKAAQEEAKKEAYNAKKRAKGTENARIKQRQKLISEASAAGKEISEEELNAQVETFMKNREERKLKTAEKKAEKEAMQRAFPKFDRKESYAHRKSELTTSFATPLVYHSEPEEEIFESQPRAAAKPSIREPLSAIARERRDQFNKTASRKTCADLDQGFNSQGLAARVHVTPEPGDSSEESEEDPDDDPSPASSHTASNDAQVEDFDECEETEDDSTSDESEEDEFDGLPKKLRKSDKLVSNDLDSQVVKSLVQRSSQSGVLVDKPYSEIVPETIFTYTVRCLYRKHRMLRKPVTIEIFLDRNEANNYILDFLKKRTESRRRPPKVLKCYNPIKELYSCDIDWQLDGTEPVESVTLWIRRELKTITNVDNFKDKKYAPRLPKKCWLIKKKLLQRIVEVGKPIREKETEEVIKNVADLAVANDMAYKMFLELVKPGKIDDVATWTNDLTPELQKQSDEHSEKGLPLNFEVDTEDSIPWMADQYVTMGVMVELYDMEGPLN